MMQDAENGVMSNAVIFRKVGNTLRNLSMSKSHGELTHSTLMICGAQA